MVVGSVALQGYSKVMWSGNRGEKKKQAIVWKLNNHRRKERSLSFLLHRFQKSSNPKGSPHERLVCDWDFQLYIFQPERGGNLFGVRMLLQSDRPYSLNTYHKYTFNPYIPSLLSQIHLRSHFNLSPWILLDFSSRHSDGANVKAVKMTHFGRLLTY